ncbi:MAG: ABC transporter permease [Anaerolineaceae bacterium]|jgi:ABC-2 type transport system permease protein
MKNLIALSGIIRNEILLQFKTKLFTLSLIQSILIVLLWGYLAGLQAQPMDHLRVGVVAGTPYGAILIESAQMNAIVYANAAEAEQAVLYGEVVAAVFTPAGEDRLTILLDDTQGAAARAALLNITSALIAAVPGAQAAPGAPAGAFPAAFEIREAWGLEMNDPIYLLRLLGAGLAPMVVLSNALAFSGVTLISEKTAGTIYFLALAPISRIWIITGKLIANTLLIAVSTILTILIAIFLFGVTPTGSLPLLFLAALLAGIGLMGLCYAISAYTKDERTFRVVAGLPLMMPMMLLSGIMYPIAMFPEWVQSLGQVFPITWLVEIAHTVFFKGGVLADVWQPMLLLGVFSCAMLLLGAAVVSRLMRIQ